MGPGSSSKQARPQSALSFIGVLLIVFGALTMRNGGGAMLAVGIVLVVIGASLSQGRRNAPSQPCSFGRSLPRPDAAAPRGQLPPIPFTPVADRPVMTGTFCSQCGTQGRAGDACCRRCGAARSSLVVQPFQETHCPSCGQTHSAPVEAYCRTCGVANA